MIPDSLIFALDVTLPISLIILLGMILKRWGLITDEFAYVGANLVFKVSLPCLLFVNIATTQLSQSFPVNLTLFALVFISIAFALCHAFAFLIPNRGSRGAFVQGACRGNIAIVGLALSVNAFGEQILPMASMYLAVMVLPLNVYSILTLYYHQEQSPSVLQVIKAVLTNPLAIAISLAIAFAFLPLQLPSLLIDTGNYIGGMTLPLALLCVGASIRWYEFRASKLLYLAIAGKIMILPVLATVLGYMLGLRGVELGVLYIMMGAPTAAAAYPMVRSIGGDHHLTAAIIAGSTVLSVFTSTLGLFILRLLLWV